MSINIAIADDQRIVLRSLGILVRSFPYHQVVLEAINGQELIDKLKRSPQSIDIVLMDVEMPVMDGVTATKIITEDFPAVKVVALSIKDDDFSILRMIRAGCCAYLAKDIEPDKLKRGLTEVYETGYFNADLISTNYRRLLQVQQMIDALKLSDRETTFLKLSISELTYKEIAQKMFLSEKTIDGYREALFQKLNVKTRVGMALEAIRYRLVTFP